MIKEYTTNSKIVWKKGIDFPEWMIEESLQTLDSDYLLPSETPKTGMERVARRAAELLDMPRLKEPLFESLWKGWICLSTPIWCNFGATRALPISCFGTHIVDSLEGIYSTLKENAIMTQI